MCGIRSRATLERNYCATECTRQRASIYTPVLLIYICTRGAPLIMQREQRSWSKRPCRHFYHLRTARSLAECGVRPAFALSKANPAPLHKGAAEKWHPLLSSHHTLAELSPTMYMWMCVCANNATDNCFRTATIYRVHQIAR